LIREILNYAEASVQSVSRTIDEVEQELDEHPLPLALPNVIVGEKYPVAYNDDEESIIKSQTVTALKTQIQEEDQHISTSVQELEDNKRILPEHFVKFLSDKGLEGDLQKLISHGIERHFAKDYVSSIHILIPQVEATLRDLLSSKGFKPLQIKEKDNVMDLELGKMLTKEDTKRLLKEDFRKYLYVKFADQKGMNLRNGVSHRLLPYAEFEHANSLATILAILLITERLI
jgi:GTPase SAR1 family protein